MPAIWILPFGRFISPDDWDTTLEGVPEKIVARAIAKAFAYAAGRVDTADGVFDVFPRGVVARRVGSTSVKLLAKKTFFNLAKKPNITKPYSRPNNATTPAQRRAVQNQPCVECKSITDRQVANHKKALVQKYYETGAIDKSKMRNIDSVNTHCPRCSASQGGLMSAYSKMKKN